MMRACPTSRRIGAVGSGYACTAQANESPPGRAIPCPLPVTVSDPALASASSRALIVIIVPVRPHGLQIFIEPDISI